MTFKNIACGLALVSMTAIAGRQAPQTPFKASIEGVVQEAQTGRPIAGVKVHLFEAARFVPSSTAPAITDAEGRVTLNITAPGTYRLLPEKSGLVYSRPSGVKRPQPGILVRVSEAGHATQVNLRMATESSISGQILDSTTGQPLPSVSVYAGIPGFDNFGNPRIHSVPRPPEINRFGFYSSAPTATSNDRGEFRIYGLQPGSYYLSALAVFGAPTRYHPGVNEVAKATVIVVEAGGETRVAPMRMESPSSAVQVRLRFPDPAVAGLGLVVDVLGADSSFGIGGGRGTLPRPLEMTLTLPRGLTDLLTSARSRENDLFYARETFEVGTEDITREVALARGLRITGSLKLEDLSGKSMDASGILCRLNSVSPVATAQSAPYGCLRGQVAPARYVLEMSGMPPDAFVASAKSGDRDMLRDGLTIERDTHIDIALLTPGAVIRGKVSNGKGEQLSDATVVLVPDAPYRDAGVLYRTDISTHDGTFELRGIAPGNYLLFAWSDLHGTAYRNAEFLKNVETKGKPLRIEKAPLLSVDLVAIE
jgi:5-hydroxyisourate hydrolase-like protein (transthyretin family)